MKLVFCLYFFVGIVVLGYCSVGVVVKMVVLCGGIVCVSVVWCVVYLVCEMLGVRLVVDVMMCGCVVCVGWFVMMCGRLSEMLDVCVGCVVESV